MTLQRSRTAPGQARTAPGQTLAPRPTTPDGHGQLPLGVVRLSGLDGVRLPDDSNSTSQTPWSDDLKPRAAPVGTRSRKSVDNRISALAAPTNHRHCVTAGAGSGPPGTSRRTARFPHQLAPRARGDNCYVAPGSRDDASTVRYRQVDIVILHPAAVDDLATTIAAITDADELKPTSAARMADRFFRRRHPFAGTMDRDSSRTEYFLETEFRGAACGT